MARTTSSLVEGVLLDDYDGSSNLTPFVNSANRVVTRVASCASKRNNSLSVEELKDLETWLAAHMYMTVQYREASKSHGGASSSFQGQTGMNLDYTPYGQTAKMLDFSGCLNSLGKSAGVVWGGKLDSERLDYDDL